MVEFINSIQIESYELIYATGPKHYDEIINQIKIIYQIKGDLLIYYMIMNIS